ncbi:MAG: dTMP kinase [Chlorobium phaeobacteroides]|uniref:Thymidylate kinase n=1 Tax=Chlorobium phaeobacteroides (strain BS1) TaxID=331678 RepID=B3EQ38_CHLPB|nr:dTMP kinase [Chlorobium phaeobacteroides]MBL6956025.1 dTMP kinase [Chlorobium phaeobacteroides]
MLITFEGIDGAGKSTQVKKLKKYLVEKGREVLTLREPGGTVVAEKIRELLLESKHDITPMGELLLFSASRAELVQQVILPELEKSKVIILDRFFDSTTAYQGYGRGLDLNMLQKINDISTFGLQPDLTFFLDISPEDALIRKFSEKSLPLAFENNEMDRMESSGLSFYQRVREGYLKLAIAEKKRFVLFDACADPDSIHAQIIQKVNACSTPRQTDT